MRKRVLLIACLAVVLAIPAFAQSQSQGQSQSKNSIMQQLEKKDEFSTFVKALKAANMTDMLQGRGEYTVFAPTNSAFEQLPEGTLNDLLKPENKQKLQKILEYHIVRGKLMANQLEKMKRLQAIDNQPIQVSSERGQLKVDGAQIVQKDITASNGVIQSIDKVMMPPTVQQSQQSQSSQQGQQSQQGMR